MGVKGMTGMNDDSFQLHRDGQPHSFATADSLGYLLYRSVARPGLDSADLDRILDKARSWNASVGLTGCLHHEDGMFFQWLEGPRFRLFQLIENLRNDDRHVNVTILDQGRLDKRLFSAWEMRFSDREAASLLEWLADRRNLTGQGGYASGVGEFLQSLRV